MLVTVDHNKKLFLVSFIQHGNPIFALSSYGKEPPVAGAGNTGNDLLIPDVRAGRGQGEARGITYNDMMLFITRSR